MYQIESAACQSCPFVRCQEAHIGFGLDVAAARLACAIDVQVAEPQKQQAFLNHDQPMTEPRKQKQLVQPVEQLLWPKSGSDFAFRPTVANLCMFVPFFWQQRLASSVVCGRCQMLLA